MCFGVYGLDVHQQRVVAQMASLAIGGTANEVFVWYPATLTSSTRHWTEIGRTRRWL